MTAGIQVARGQSYSSIEAAALLVRDVFGLGPMDMLPGLTLFEQLGALEVVGPDRTLINVQYDVTDQLGPGNEGATRFLPAEGVIELRLDEATYQALECEDARARFTLFHEIGHAVLHTDELVRLATIPHANLARGPAHPPYLDSEWQANAFAGALAMPAVALASLVGGISVSTVQKRFAVSAQAASIRIQLFNQRRDELVPGRQRL